MIEANQNWQNAIAQQVKQPLYVFEIPDLGIIIASFPAGVDGRWAGTG